MVRRSSTPRESSSARSMSSRAASKSRWRCQQRERHERMFALSASHGQAGALGEPERLVEQRERSLDAVELVATAAEPEQHICALDVRERLCLGDRACIVEELGRGAVVAGAHLREPAAHQCPHLKLGHAGCAGSRGQRREGRRSLLVLLRLVQRLRASKGSFEPGALVGRDAAREEAGVDPEAVGKPFDRPLGRARLAALDLRDVLLREAVARELALRQPRGDAKLAEPFPEAKSLRAGPASGAAGCFSHGHVLGALL